MTPDQWTSVESHFAALNELPPPERMARLAAIQDEVVRREVESLLGHIGSGHTIPGLVQAVATEMDTVELAPPVRPGIARLEWLETGVQVGGKYRLRQRLGEGGMGVVYQAFDEVLERAVALKFLITEASGDGQRERLLAEARAASALNHPNIVTVYDFGSDRGIDFIAMEFVDGETLHSVISRGPLPVETLVAIGIQVADVLDAAHRAQIVHGDIKPANILLTRSGQAKLADFGIARRLPAQRPGETTGDAPGEKIFAGTLAYMSPEQSRGEPLDGRSDLFSLGVVLHEAACGARPRGANLGETEALSDSALEGILERLLAPDPADRFETAGDLRDALRRLTDGGSSAELPAFQLPSRVTRIIGRDRELAGVTSLLAQEDVRLVNLTGPGGIGKTRLAIEVAHQIARQFESVWFIALESVHEPQAIAPAILRGLGLREADARSPEAKLIEYLERRHLLLVLDNFEQLTGGAPVLADLLEGCPRLKILVTSRALLHLRAEREYVVPPLREDTGVALFLDRSHGGQPTAEALDAIAEICARVDGIPLAIELAAARTRLLAPKSILGRLRNRFQLLKGGARDLPQRHQTLRHTIDWSYDLLEDEEKRLLQRLSVFDDGAGALRSSLGVRQTERQKVRSENWIAAARAALGSSADDHLAQGHRMRLEKAIECALASAAV